MVEENKFDLFIYAIDARQKYIKTVANNENLEFFLLIQKFHGQM